MILNLPKTHNNSNGQQKGSKTQDVIRAAGMRPPSIFIIFTLVLTPGSWASPVEIGVDPPTQQQQQQQAPRNTAAAFPYPVEVQRLLKPLGSVLRFQRSQTGNNDYPPPTIYEVRFYRQQSY
jgi:hypothetical protein